MSCRRAPDAPHCCVCDAILEDEGDGNWICPECGEMYYFDIETEDWCFTGGVA